ncbi:ABC transporter ATP-binding protein [Burkholderia stagnalis]
MAQSTDLIALRGVSKSYGEQTVLSDINLSVGKGEFVTFLGPSGCGKTTTLRMIAGFVKPSTGSIALRGAVVSSPTTHVPPERRGLGMVFQSYAVWPHMSVQHNIAMPLKIRKLPAAEIERRCRDALRLCRLESYAERSPHELSGGQLQRVALARALSYDPDILLLDEPLSNLDVALRDELRHELGSLHRKIGATFVLVTHDQTEAMSLSDKVVVMHQGGIEQIGSPQEIYRHPRTEFVATFVSDANILRGDITFDGAAGRPQFRAGGFCVALPEPQQWRAGATHLMVRPESLELDAPLASGTADDSRDGFHATVTNVLFYGTMQEIWVERDGVQLRALVSHGGQTSAAGSRVFVRILPGGIQAIQ